MILASPDSDYKLVRHKGVSAGRLAAILKETEHGMIEDMVKPAAGPTDLSRFLATRRGKRVG